MRQLKYHEQKLLKKVNFYDYKKEKNVREIKILRKYHIQKREDYHKCVLPAPSPALTCSDTTNSSDTSNRLWQSWRCSTPRIPSGER